MAFKRPPFSKLTPPRLHRAISRERLFLQLDKARLHHPAIRVAGPPGAGKSTLVASWLTARAIKSIWYQVDTGDADLATFFYYLGEASRSFLRRGQRPLPLLTPEYASDVEGFARRFFRELFARMPPGGALVLDNYQEFPADVRIHRIVAQAVDEAPEGRILVLVSRADLPAEFSRNQANGQVATLGWRDLQLDQDEVRALALGRIEVDDDTLDYLVQCAAGWAAGLVLIIEQLCTAGPDPGLVEISQDAVFQYFATQVFGQFPARMQRFLMMTALLPRLPVKVCAALTGDNDAAARLHELYRRHLFTDRRPGMPPTYGYHALFRGFLLKLAASTFDEESLTDMRARSAHLMEQEGDRDAAVRLFAEASQWRQVQRLIVESAPGLLAQGRWQTFDEWVALLPDSSQTDSAWLTYWSGMSRLATQPTLARKRLEQAHTMFTADDERDGALLAAASVVQCLFLEAAEFNAIDRWFPVLVEGADSTRGFASPAVELQIWSALLIAIVFGRPGHPLSDRCADRILALMSAPIDANMRITAAAALMLHCLYVGKFQLGRRLEAQIKLVLAEPELTALNAAFWYCYLGYLSVADHTFAHGHEVFDQAERIAEREGFHYVLTTAYSGRAVLWRVGPKVEEFMRRSEPNMASTRPYDVAHYLGNALYRAADRGDWASAVALGERTLTYLENTGTLYQRLIWSVPYAWAFAELGEIDLARERLSAADVLIARTGADCYAALLTFAHANLARVLRNEDRYAACLRAGFAQVARDDSKRGYAFWMPTASAPRLCADALERGIEIECVRHYVRDYPLDPPPDAPEAWPWPVRIYTLGRFSVTCNDSPLTFTHKQPRRPLALLKAIVALGEVDVPVARLIDALWSDLDGDAAHHALEVALVRLRRILARPDALRMHNHAVSLNRAEVWTDVRAFEALTEQLMAEEEGTPPPARTQQRLFDLYQGEFIATESDAPWAVSCRERLRARLIRVVAAIGRRLEAGARWDEALRWYRKGIESDDLAESLHQGVIRCLMQQRRRSEALGAYQRMSQLLAARLGTTPGPDSVALQRALLE